MSASLWRPRARFRTRPEEPSREIGVWGASGVGKARGVVSTSRLPPRVASGEACPARSSDSASEPLSSGPTAHRIPASARTPGARRMTMVGTRILLIDDEPGILETLSQILADEGYVVISAPEGEQALEIADVFPPDVVVTDLRLPGLDGIA